MQRAGCRTSASQSMPARLNGNIGEDPMIEPLMNAAPLQPVLSRRGFIFGISALAGGLVLGTQDAFAQAGAQAPTPAAAKPGQPELTAWVVIQSDDSVLIRMAPSGACCATARWPKPPRPAPCRRTFPLSGRRTGG